jgi:uncharacterized protein (DUF1330 family)
VTGAIDPSREAMAAFRGLPAGQPIAMINLLRFRDQADYAPDHASYGAGLSGQVAYKAYSQAAAAPFTRAGGRQVWVGKPELTVIGPADEAWDLAFIAEYPSGAAFLAMLQDPDYQAAVIHRQAAVADSRLIRCQPQTRGASPSKETGAPA